MELLSRLWNFKSMPKFYVYLGISVFVYSNEHSPIHVHGYYQGGEGRAEIHVEDDIIQSIAFDNVKGKPVLPPAQLRDFKKLVQHEAEDIVKKWREYFEQNLHVEPRIITQRIR
jgi:hypothetical protein